MDTIVLLHFLLGPLIAVFGLITRFFPPKKINYIYGYRTKRSMQSQEAWDCANDYASKAMAGAGLFTTLCQVLAYTLLPSDTGIIISVAILVIAVVTIIPLTERYLKSKGF